MFALILTLGVLLPALRPVGAEDLGPDAEFVDPSAYVDEAAPLDEAALAAEMPFEETVAAEPSEAVGVVEADPAAEMAPSAEASLPLLNVVPAPAPAPVVNAPLTVRSPEYGMSMFVWGNPATTSRDLKMATDAGFSWQKTLFQWRQIEGTCKGCFDWTEADRVVRASNAAGVKILARIDFQPTWARADRANNGPPDNYRDLDDFLTALVTRYGTGSTIGRVHAIEIWNEVNLSKEWGEQSINREQAADYVRLLTGAYKAVKAVDPSMIVVTAGLSPTGVIADKVVDDLVYLQWLFEAGLKGGVNYDVLGAHGNTQAPVADAPINSLPGFNHASFYFRRVEQLRDLQVQFGDANRQIWLLEFGWTSDKLNPNYAWFAVTEEQKAQTIVQAFQYARQNWSPWMGVMTLWTLPDPTWNTDREELWWAITNRDGSARPAYLAVLDAFKRGLLGPA